MITHLSEPYNAKNPEPNTRLKTFTHATNIDILARFRQFHSYRRTEHISVDNVMHFNGVQKQGAYVHSTGTTRLEQPDVTNY